MLPNFFTQQNNIPYPNRLTNFLPAGSKFVEINSSKRENLRMTESDPIISDNGTGKERGGSKVVFEFENVF